MKEALKIVKPVAKQLPGFAAGNIAGILLEVSNKPHAFLLGVSSFFIGIAKGPATGIATFFGVWSVMMMVRENLMAFLMLKKQSLPQQPQPMPQPTPTQNFLETLERDV